MLTSNSGDGVRYRGGAAASDSPLPGPLYTGTKRSNSLRQNYYPVASRDTPMAPTPGICPIGDPYHWEVRDD